MEDKFDAFEEGPLAGERKQMIQPTCLNDPKLKALKEVLMDWINKTLQPEHIVVKNLEEDLYDGLVLHHLLATFSTERLDVDEIAVTREAQLHKLRVILEALNNRLGVNDDTAKWSVALLHSKDLLATIHLLVSMVRCFQPSLALPPDVAVEVVCFEVNRSGIKSEKHIENLTAGQSNAYEDSRTEEKTGAQQDIFDQLMLLEPEKISAVKQAILHFVNKNMSPLGVQVTEMEKQFADGVILLLLIGQLEGFFIPLHEFVLSPSTDPEMVQNVSLALDLLSERDMPVANVDPQAIVSQDVKSTLRVLYVLFKKHKGK